MQGRRPGEGFESGWGLSQGSSGAPGGSMGRGIGMGMRAGAGTSYRGMTPERTPRRKFRLKEACNYTDLTMGPFAQLLQITQVRCHFNKAYSLWRRC